MRSPAGTRSPVPASPDRPLVRLALAAAGLLAVAACGGPVPAPGGTALPSATATATPSPSATASPTATPGRATAVPAAPTRVAAPAPTGLPWPTSTATGAATLQKEVDGGGQPWLLDPGEVASSYAAFRGWRDPRVSGAGTHRTVTTAAGTHVLTFAQPARKGDGGIWLVTADAAS